MTIAILDDGICKNEISTPVETYCIGGERKEDFIQMDFTSHATVCAKIIEKYSAPDKIIDIAFLGEEGVANIQDLCLALELCSTLNVDAINLSNGIENYNERSDEYQRLLCICKKIYDSGIKIYAAQSNSGRQTIPANFPYTISVEQIDKDNNILFSPYRRSDIYADGKHVIHMNGKRVITMRCNSYACAYAVSQIKRKKSSMLHRIFFSNLVTSNILFYTLCDCNKMKEFYDLYLDKKDNLIGKVYLNRLSFLKKRALKKEKIKFLSLEMGEYKKTFIKKYSEFYPMEIPVIYIQNTSGAVVFVKAICASFLEQGYNASILSINKYDFLEGVCYLPKECMYHYMRLFSYYNKCDILFVITDDVEEKGIDDVGITMNHDKIMVAFQDEVVQFQDKDAVVDSIITYYS